MTRVVGRGRKKAPACFPDMTEGILSILLLFKMKKQLSAKFPVFGAEPILSPLILDSTNWFGSLSVNGVPLHSPAPLLVGGGALSGSVISAPISLFKLQVAHSMLRGPPLRRPNVWRTWPSNSYRN